MNQKTLILIILISLAIGLVYIYPDLLFLFELKNDFKGITLTAAPDELGYLARINAVHKGNFLARSIDIYERRNDPWLQPFLSEFVEGCFGRLLNINAALLDVVMSFLLPITLFWLIFLLFRNLYVSRLASFCGSALILFGYDLFTARAVDTIRSIFVLQNYSLPLWFLRPISPQFNHIIFIAAILMIYISISKKSRQHVFFAAIFSGAFFYIHPHYWIYIFIGIGVFFLLSFISKDKESLKIISYFLLLSFLVSIPFWLHIYKLKANPDFSSAFSFTGLVHTRQPILPPFHFFLITIVIALLWYFKEPNRLLLSSFLMGGILCLNQQIVTGFTLVAGHWQGYTNKTFIMICLIVSFSNAGRKLLEGKISVRRFVNKVKSSILMTAVVFLYIVAIAQQRAYYNANEEQAKDNQSIAGAYNWLKHNANNKDVILSDPLNFLSRRSPYTFEVLTYTNSYTYLPSGCITLASKEEREDRFLYAFNFFGYPAYKIESFLRYANGAFLAGMEALPEYGGTPLEEEAIRRIKGKYISLKDVDIIEVMNKFKLDYIIIDYKDLGKYNKQVSKERLKTVYTDSKFCVLKVL